MPTPKLYEFTLVVNGVDKNTPELEDQLYAAGCDDALLHFCHDTAYLDFSCENDSLENAVIDAINRVESIALKPHVISILPDEFVSESDIAKRLNKNRQNVSLWVKGLRRNNIPFPRPILKLADKAPMWRWQDVVTWLLQQKLIDNIHILENAKFISHLNSLLAERDPEVAKYRKKLRQKLKTLLRHNNSRRHD